MAAVLDEPRTDTCITINVRDAAKLLGVSPGLIYKLAADGDVPSLKIGGRVLLRRDTIEALLDDRRCRSQRRQAVAS